MTLLAVLVIGCLALWIKQSFDQSVDRGLGDALGKSLQGASDSLSRVSEDDYVRLLRVASATLDLVAPPDREKGKTPFRRVADLAIGAARRELREEGLLESALLDHALGTFERRLKESPNDPDRLADLALVLTLKLEHARSEGKDIDLAHRADRALDGALEIDGSSWTARLYKASLAYLHGDRDAAIRRFEALLEEESMSEREELALAYVFLGKLYLEEGSRDKARKLWERGLSAFPENKDFAERLERLSGRSSQ